MRTHTHSSLGSLCVYCVVRVDRGLVDIIKDNWINKTPLSLQHPHQRERLIPLACTCTHTHTHTCFHILWNNHTHAYTHFRLLTVCVRNHCRHTPPLLLMCLWTAERSVILWKHTYTHLYIYACTHELECNCKTVFVSGAQPPPTHTHTSRNFEDKKADKSLRAVCVCACVCVCVCVCVCACSRCLGHSGQSPSLASQRGNSRAFSPDSLQRRGRFISICIFCVLYSDALFGFYFSV